MNYTAIAQAEVVRASQWNARHPDLLYLKYEMAQSSGQELQAKAFLSEAIEQGKDDIDSLYTLARLHAKAGEMKMEVALYRRILERSPNHPEANYCLAMYYDKELHDRESAIRHLKITREHLPYRNEWRKRCDEILTQLEGNRP